MHDTPAACLAGPDGARAAHPPGQEGTTMEVAGVRGGRRLPLAARAAALAAVLLAAGCGGNGPASTAGSPDYQKGLAFAHCMRSHGVPGWPDPLPQGGFPRGGAGGNSGPQADSAMNACQHLLPPRPALSAAQQARVLAQDLKWAQCMRSHGFPGFSDPAVRRGAGIVITAPAGFDPNSPQAQAASKACKPFEGPFILAGGAS
jgi:hypothetical protein